MLRRRLLKQNAPGDTLSGQFSVSATKKVYFSRGNLQYDGTNWKFAEHQYDYISTATGYPMDHFTWGNEGSPAYNGTDYIYGYSNLSGSKDWGSNMGTGWYTLSKDEWTYLFNTRSASSVGGTQNGRYAKAKVNGVQGVILFPDTYTHPGGVTAPKGVNATAATGWNGNNYSSADWTKMESAGCVFLPAAGQRNSNSVSYAGSYGKYWSSTASISFPSNSYYVNFDSGSVSTSNEYGSRNLGFSVRLVRPVEEGVS